MAAKRKPKMVYENRKLDINHRSLTDLIPELQNLMNELGEDATISIFEEWGSVVCEIEWRRPETTEEKQKRLAVGKKHKANRRKQYEKLKREFGDE